MATLKDETDAHVLAVGVLEQLATRIALCSTTEESAQGELSHVKDAITSFKPPSGLSFDFGILYRDLTKCCKTSPS